MRTHIVTIVLLAGLAGCSRCGRSRVAPKYQPPKGTQALPAAPSNQVQGWALVAGGGDQAPFLTEPDPMDVAGYLARGQLVERRTETRADFIPNGPLLVERMGPDGALREEGALAAIQPTAFDLGFTFESDLAPAPAGLPARAVICEAAAAQSRGALTRDACDHTGQLLWIPPRRLALWAARAPDQSVLLLLELAPVDGRPAVLSSLELGLLHRVRLLPLPADDTALVIEERLAGTARTGIHLVFALATAEGKLQRAGELERDATEQRGALVANTSAIATIDRAAHSLTVRGEELVQDPATGEVRSRANLVRRAVWDPGSRRMKIER